MGDIADMVLEGALCQECGEFMGHETGYPQTCDACAGKLVSKEFDIMFEQGARWNDGPHIADNWQNRKQVQVPARVKVVCPQCGKRIKAAGFYQHMRDVHTGGE